MDEDHANPLKVWHDMGEPAQLSAEQIKLLQESAVPLVHTERLCAADGELGFSLALQEDSVVSFDLIPVSGHSDRGYSYERAVRG